LNSTTAPAPPRSLVLHGHFYQPPREDPWTGLVPRELSASPFHDWNQRVHDECYRAVTAARVLDGNGRIRRVMNALEWMSWDAGPTLLSWLATQQPHTYTAFLEADAGSVQRLGHGGALAAPYHHIILPLASRRDKVTEVRWGAADFRRRFGREPAGMWLPEAAVDMETLEVLAAEGIRFTVLGPGQVTSVPEGGLPGRVRLGGGRSLAVFVYDGGLSHDVAFGHLLHDAHAWVERMARTGDEGTSLVSLATDGETFGHHQRWGDMALAAAIVHTLDRRDVRLENFASFLARRPPVEEVEVVEPSSWSCVHGVDRWRRECGCRLDPGAGTQQAWRGVLRKALDDLAGDLADLYETEAGALFRDPWGARDGYGAVVDGSEAARARYVERRAPRPLDGRERRRALELLELQRDALRMFTSCGWFFDDLARLEPIQILRYAAHALDLAGPAGKPWEARLRGALADAASNDPAEGDGRRIWDDRVRLRLVPTPPHLVPGPPPQPTAASLGRSPPGLALELEPRVRDLIRSVERLATDHSPGHLAALERDLGALRDSGHLPPFEVQTVLWRVVAKLSRSERAALAGVARALGFSEDALAEPAPQAAPPVHFVFGLHVHQPVGNFDAVFQSHADDVYEPFLRRLADAGCLPLTLHVSGPLLEWLEAHRHPYLDLVGELASDGRVELLLSGFYEPVLPALDRMDRARQIGWMREWLLRRWGVEATGCWLTERVWQPELAADLADAGVRYALVDDRHFLVTGFEEEELHRPFHTEHGGKGLHLFSIDERLRYLVPFRPPDELASYLRGLRATGRPVAVLADDGEKFGGWPGTAEWVWKTDWLDRFLDTLHTLRAGGEIVLSTPSRVLEAVPTDGPVYLPTASYREMEGWSIGPRGAERMERVTQALEDGAFDAGARALVRGSHWLHFLSRYPESNRMHKRAQLLSDLCRLKGDPPAARRAVGRAQCNDAYWHGVFGGLYLRHLRRAVWANLAEAEALLRKDEDLTAEIRDVDGDGRDEIWVHGPRVSLVVAPTRGGAVESFLDLEARLDLADVLTRRREAYHRAISEPIRPDAPPVEGDGGMPSLTDLESRLRFSELPPFDREERALLVDRVLPADLSEADYAGGGFQALRSWALAVMDATVETGADGVLVTMASNGPGRLDKRLHVREDGTLEVIWHWDAAAFPPEARFAPELSLASEVDLEPDPEPEALWRYEIRTVSKSERGAEESVQGVSVTLLWPARLGEASLVIRRPRPAPITPGPTEATPT